MAVGATFGRMVGIIVKAIYRSVACFYLFNSWKPNNRVQGLPSVRYLCILRTRSSLHYARYICLLRCRCGIEIVVLVTKAVGDFLGTNGIADEMIRFNGFPFLEKDDHAYNVSENIIATTEVKCFPIVASATSRTLSGYIGRTELRYVLAGNHDHDDLDLAQGPAVGIEEDVPTSLFDTATSGDGLKFWPWVNQVCAALILAFAQPKLLAPQTPITVSPQLPLEIVMQMFKRMGLVVIFFTVFHSDLIDSPRIILVEDHGALAGLVTVKDVLRFIATEKPDRESSWDERGGLDGFLEELWMWTDGAVHKFIAWTSRVLRR
ncbi:glycerol ethanol, ferric requiring protein [Salix suchowensis]|nr:glycerol ethanol, ferric requiring protein [Salix suchowensis]